MNARYKKILLAIGVSTSVVFNFFSQQTYTQTSKSLSVSEETAYQKVESHNLLNSSWLKYINKDYVTIVRDTKSTLVDPTAIAYLFEDKNSDQKIALSAHNQYPTEEIVDAIAEGIINRPKSMFPNHNFLVTGGNTVKEDWGLYSFTPSTLSFNSDPLYFEPINLILTIDSTGKWIAFVQSTENYDYLIQQIPDSILSAESRNNYLLASRKLYAENN